MRAQRRLHRTPFSSRASVFLRLVFLLIGLFAVLQTAQAAPYAEPLHPATFDLKAARRLDDLNVEELPIQIESPPSVRVKEIRFTSTRWDENGVARPIRIQAFVAIPCCASGQLGLFSCPEIVMAGLG